MMKARTTNNVQSKRSTKSGRKDQKLQKTNSQKKLSEQEKHKDLDAKEEFTNISTAASDSTTQSDPSEAYQTVDVRYLDDDNQETDSCRVVEKTEKQNNFNGSVCDLEKDVDEQECKDANIDKEIDTDAREGTNADVWEDASNGALSAGSENEAADVTENNDGNTEDGSSKEKIMHLETRIEKLEEELREVAALEISLYSVVPDHCSSAHKLHTPARRISRILGCIVLEMYTGVRPWPFEDSKDLLPLLLNGNAPEIPESLPWNARQFLQTCFASNPVDRGTASDLLKHIFLQNVSDQMHVSVTGAGDEKRSVVVVTSKHFPKKTLKINIIPPKSPRFKKSSNRPLRLKIIPPKPQGCNLVPVQ